MLDKNDVVPLYVQLHRILKESIVKGEYKEGDLLPSESKMMKTFQTTRGTVRKAISELVKEGLAYQSQGKGTYVCFRQVKYSMWNFGGFSDHIKSRNETPVSQVIEQSHMTMDGKSYFKLVRARGVKQDEGVLYLTIDTSLLPQDLFPDIDQYDFAKESLYQVMREKYQVYPRRSEITMKPVLIDEKTRDLLRVDENETALLKAEGKVFNEKDIEIEKVSVIYSTHIDFKIMTTME